MTRRMLKLLFVFALLANFTLAATDSLVETRKKAEAGDAAAQNSLGLIYYIGEGVPKDTAEAAKWYRKAAEQGNAPAQFSLGFMYDNGDAGPKNSAEAVKWYRKAAEQGHFGAQGFLANCYRIGEGVPKDSAEAVKWFRKAAEQGDAHAQFNLGLATLKQGRPDEALLHYRAALRLVPNSLEIKNAIQQLSFPPKD